MRKRHMPKRLGRKKHWILMLLCINIFLLLLVVKESRFVTTPWPDYLWKVQQNIVKWTGAFMWILGLAWIALNALIWGKRELLSPQKIYDYVAALLDRSLQRPAVSRILLILLVILAPLLSWKLFSQELPFLPTGAVIAITPDLPQTQAMREMYIAREGWLDIRDITSFRPVRLIEFRHALSREVFPGSVTIAPTRREVYVADSGLDTVHVIDSRGAIRDIQVGKAPRWIAVAPDENRAFVSNEQPIPRGTISVIDLAEKSVIKTISGVNCPEGLAVTPNGRQLYVASQCGAPDDPVFVFNTRSLELEATIPGLAVGLFLVITPDGRKVYVARGGYQTLDSAGKALSVPPQLSVITTSDNRIKKTLPCPDFILSLAVTLDSRYILIGGLHGLSVLRTDTDRIVKTIPLASSASGIGISDNERAFVWLPQENRVFALGLGGIGGSSIRG